MAYERGSLLRLLGDLADLDAHLGDDSLLLRDHSAECVDLVGHRCDSRLVVARVALNQHKLHRSMVTRTATFFANVLVFI